MYVMEQHIKLLFELTQWHHCQRAVAGKHQANGVSAGYKMNTKPKKKPNKHTPLFPHMHNYM